MSTANFLPSLQIEPFFFDLPRRPVALKLRFTSIPAPSFHSNPPQLFTLRTPSFCFCAGRGFSQPVLTCIISPKTLFFPPNATPRAQGFFVFYSKPVLRTTQFCRFLPRLRSYFLCHSLNPFLLRSFFYMIFFLRANRRP